jgi:hypothetical protein
MASTALGMSAVNLASSLAAARVRAPNPAANPAAGR